MKKIGGVWLPDGEQHLVKWMLERNEYVDGKLTYQHHKLRAALAHVKQWRAAVDVGAHCGLWSMHLVKRFMTVHAFEPVAAHRACFEANVAGPAPALLYAVALGNANGRAAMHSDAASSGDTVVAQGDEIDVRCMDEYDLQDIDFIKLDCEGYELFALKGGEQTLLRCKPCIIVEQKPGKAQRFGLGETDAVIWLQSLGAHLRQVIAGDYILSWD